jgi:hypothetical protein
MHSFTMAGPQTSVDVWTWYQAAREVRNAIEIMEDVAAMLSGLLADTEWEAAGVRALRDALRGVQSASRAELGELHARSAELDAVDLR